MIGTTVGSYRILDRVSVGGMGTIYRAEHTLIGRIAAIKVLHAELSTNRDIINRFFNEAKATTTIKHPGIVEIFDFGYVDSGHAYIVMEFLDGMTLSQRIKIRGPMPEGEAALYLRGVCSALAAAHAKGIVHRDLKPDNIFLVPDVESPTGERSKLLDFGIAKLTDIGAAGSVTKTGAVMGTPTYMSPEQCKGTGEVDHRADLYSIGCMFYELVSGRTPFVNYGAGELIGSHLFVQPEPVSNYATHVSHETESLIMALLEKLPERRVQTARELADLLTQIAQRHVSMPLATPHDMTRIEPILPSGYRRAPSVPMIPQPPYIPTPAQNRTPVEQFVTHQTPKPTTLSGAASQSVVMLQPPPQPRRSRVGIAIGIGIVAIGVGIGVVFVGGGKSNDGTQQIERATPTERAETKPADTKPPEPKPATTAPEPKPAETPVATKPVETKPVETKPVETKPVETKPSKPVETKPADPKPTDTKPADPKPADTKPTKPVETKPVKPVKPTKPAKPAKPTNPQKPNDPLLENDL